MKKFKIDWLLNKELALGSAPIKESHIKLLLSNGIKSVLSLCGEKEVKLNFEIDKKFLHKRVVLKDHRSNMPSEIKDLKNAIEALGELMQNKPVYVHCFAGVERAPIVCMAWLIVDKKIEFQDALDYTMQLHPGTNPLPNQLELLRKL